ncbi:MAG: hypothetical protein OXF79_29800 [Chloroflexi bacterium]|nr:hypothetical protein [Chloroflexota bacterium]
MSIAAFNAASPRLAGVFLLLTALATAIMVPTRIMADADQPTLRLSLEAIDENTLAYIYSAVARIASGIFLVVAAGLLRSVTTPWFSAPAKLATTALSLSGVITVVSGVCALILTNIGPSAIAFDDAGLFELASRLDTARWITGKLGFSLAGLGLIALAPVQWRVGGLLKGAAVADLVIGVVMLFIWVDAATAMHRVSGIAFLAWLVVSGIWLVAGRLKPPAPTLDADDAPQNATGEYEYGRPRY